MAPEFNKMQSELSREVAEETENSNMLTIKEVKTERERETV